MTVRHLIDEEWIVSYAAGTLSEGKMVLLSSFYDFHPDLQKQVQIAENIGAELLENLQPIFVAKQVFDNVLAKLPTATRKPVDKPVSYTAQSIDGLISLPPSLDRFLNANEIELKWKKSAPGLSQIKLWQNKSGESMRLIKIKRGSTLAKHDHTGTEMTLVLSGSYHVEDQQYGKGDIEIADQDIIAHQPVIDDQEDCICLVVTEKPARFHGLLARIMQPFIGL